jgi:hypothetical protein
MQEQRSGSVGSASFRIRILDFYSFLTSFMTVYLQRKMLLYRVPSKSNKQKTYFFLASWRSLTRRAEYGSVSHRNGSPVPDPYHNLTDPEHWLLEARWVRLEVLFIWRGKKSILRNRTLTFCKPQVRQLQNVRLLAESGHLLTTWPDHPLDGFLQWTKHEKTDSNRPGCCKRTCPAPPPHPFTRLKVSCLSKIRKHRVAGGGKMVLVHTGRWWNFLFKTFDCIFVQQSTFYRFKVFYNRV